MPQDMIKKESQILGRTFFSTMFEGISGARLVILCVFGVHISSRSTWLARLTENDIGNEEDGAGNIVLVARKT